MVTEEMRKMAGSPANGSVEDFEKHLDLEALLEEHRRQGRSREAAAATLLRESELNIFRSGSAPPTVEGARDAIGSLLGGPDLAEIDLIYGHGTRSALAEEEMKSHPAYQRYYYSNERLNQRLPPPAVSKEDWRVAARRLQLGASAFGGIGEGRKEVEPNNCSGCSLFARQPGLPRRDVDGELPKVRAGIQRGLARQPSAGWVERRNDGLIGHMSIDLGTRRKSFADALQEEHGRSSSAPPNRLSHSVNLNAFDYGVEPVGVFNAQLTPLHNGLETVDILKTGASSPSLVRAQSLGSSVSHSFTSALGTSLVRSKTPYPQIIGNSPSPHLPASGERGEIPLNGLSTYITDRRDIAVALSGLNLSESVPVNEGNDGHVPSLQDFADKTAYQNNYLQHKNMNKPEVDSSSISSTPVLTIKNGVTDTKLSKLVSNGQVKLSNGATSANSYEKLLAGSTITNGSGTAQNPSIMNADFSGGYVGSSPLVQRLSTSVSRLHDIGGVEGQYLNSINHTGPGHQPSLVDPLCVQYLQQNSSSSPGATARLCDPFSGWSAIGSSQMDLSDYQNKALEALLAPNKSPYRMAFVGKSVGLNHGYYGTAFDLDNQHPTNPRSSSAFSSLGTAVPLRQSERFPHFPSTMRRSAGASMGSWNLENASRAQNSASSLLEEFKSNKTRSFELSEIADHVVEFSMDQHGSRFIQQKLETASVDEKNKIFPEIIPHAHALMTDVFGNYVIQKFFEHSTESQRKQLASQLAGHVLPLTLQMYGCRVIQKALEVVDVDQQTKMVLELDGSVMKCVRDQNGNHVIQKCIECVPQERIQFIITAFYGQVVSLSTHPYGCRVIQRVLEHCDDAMTQSIMMDEILEAVCTLAQDQYGNYVIQHVLQHGKQKERSAIIRKLAGQIVKMSQQKFASNVIEKCLVYGMPEERQLLINEILGSTDENEPLQAMMKDQFGNYVVQKVLETCDDQNRELILSRIKAHVNTLKKYTYGKHIATRVEKVIAAGERRMGMPLNPS